MEMHQKVTSAMGADATETWVRKMVEHRRGAIAMSRIVLRETTDSKVRMMANKAVAEQTREVGELEGWLKATRSAEPPEGTEWVRACRSGRGPCHKKKTKAKKKQPTQ